MSTFRDIRLTLALTLAFLFNATFRSGDMRCRVRKSQKVVQNLMFISAPNLGRAPYFWGDL